MEDFHPSRHENGSEMAHKTHQGMRSQPAIDSTEMVSG